MLNSYRFTRYHALGNDYIVMRAIDMDLPLSVPIVQRICDRNFGVGSDGILLLETIQVAGAFSLRIYNPDGSEAEKAATVCVSLRDIFGTVGWFKRAPSMCKQ